MNGTDVTFNSEKYSGKEHADNVNMEDGKRLSNTDLAEG
jgi:hypothetical protein